MNKASPVIDLEESKIQPIQIGYNATARLT